MKTFFITICIALVALFAWEEFSTPTTVIPEQPQETTDSHNNPQNNPQDNQQNPTPTTPSPENQNPNNDGQQTPPPNEDEATTFTLITLTTTQPGAEIIAAVGQKHLAETLALNRIDDKHLYQGMTVVIPLSFDRPQDFAFMPETIAAATTIPKLVIISQRTQAFGFYENGTLVRSGPVSSGKQSTQTPNRLYFANWKGKEVTSTFSDEWILKWNFNIANFEGIGLHHYAMPGYPASHSCVRFYEADAEWLYNWADQWILASDATTKLANGTPVIIYGDYAYGKAAPWKRLPTDPAAATVTQKEVEDIVTTNLATIQKEQLHREQVLASRSH